MIKPPRTVLTHGEKRLVQYCIGWHKRMEKLDDHCPVAIGTIWDWDLGGWDYLWEVLDLPHDLHVSVNGFEGIQMFELIEDLYNLSKTAATS